MKERVTILTGAGLSAGPSFFNISTLGLTKDFISYYHKDLTDDKDFIKFIYIEFCKCNNIDPTKIEDNIYQINFETILQIIEELFAYIEDTESKIHNSKNIYSVKRTVFTVNVSIITEIYKVKIPKWKDLTYLFIEKVYNHLIDLIIGQFILPNNDKNNVGMQGFKNFLDVNFDSKKFYRRIYTLNYDNWMNKFANYFDGFINDKFNYKEVINNRDIDCHYNLHGCILWNEKLIWEKVSTPEERKYLQSFNGWTISREALLPSPIISGYNKLTRINFSPLLEIFHSLTTDCLFSNIFLIIGYSFSDPHVNNNLKLIDKSIKFIVVVRYEKSCLTDNNSDFHRIRWEISEIFGVYFSNLKIRPGLNHTIDSDDKRISIFIDGIGQSFYDEYPKI